MNNQIFPPDDAEFEEHVLTKVEGGSDGWHIFYGGFGFYCPATSPIEPRPGMTARYYGRGLGSPVRGLFLDGRKVFYRTPAEDEEHREIEMYGKDAAEWLARWDAGKTVWSIEMGGLGPGYEQCIHVTCAEIVREMLNGGYDRAAWYADDEEARKAAWGRDRDRIDHKVMQVPAVKDLGLSGAQWGAAMNLAGFLVRHGPRYVMNDERVKDRHIQVSNRMRFVA